MYIPAHYIIKVDAENRITEVIEDRIVEVQAEDRLAEISMEDRVVEIPKE